MTDTRRTLLVRVRDRGDTEAWQEFFGLYAPLLEGYARSHGLSRTDAEEVRDQCLEVLARKLPDFEYERARGSFQGWLHGIVRGKVIDLARARRVRAHDSVALETLDDARSDLEREWERQWRAEHLRYALARVRESEDPERFRVFELLLVEELPVAEVSARTGLAAGQIYKLKSALLARVREILARLGDGAEGLA